MELVATSKLRRAKLEAERSRPFRAVLDQAISDILACSEIGSSVWAEKKESGKELFIVIAGDRGLAGGYNANIFRLTAEKAGSGSAVYLPIGKKALDYYRHRNADILTDKFGNVSEISVGDTFAIADIACDAFRSGEYRSIRLVYTNFVSMLTQTPTCISLLPLEKNEAKADSDPIFDGDPEELLPLIVPKYVGGIIHSAICESLASESGARRTAMNAANKNAEEMIGTLMLKYNRARQAIITQEITEIVSGAEAL